MPPKTTISRPSVRPLMHTEREELERFERVKTRILRGWKAKSEKHKNGESLSEPPDDYLAREIYEHLCKMLQPYGGWRMLERFVERSRSLKTGRFPIKGKPFKLGLVAFLGDEAEFKKQRRSQWSDAMLYAYMHGIEPRNYVGFVKQVGLKRIRAKLENKEMMPGFSKSQMRRCP